MEHHEDTHSAGTSSAMSIFVFDSPRTCSHLFRKLFLQHPKLGHILEPFLVASVFGSEGVTDLLKSTDAARSVVEQFKVLAPDLTKVTYRDANHQLQEKIMTVEQESKIPWIKDHALYAIKPEIVLSMLRSNLSISEVLLSYSNPTMIDEELLNAFKPIFLIRHPALIMKSYYEVNLENIGSDVGDEQFDWMTSVKWVRILFELYRKRTGNVPIVVDGDDVVYRTKELTAKICHHFKLDETGVSFEWEPEVQIGMPGDFFKTRVAASRAVERDQSAFRDGQHDVDAAFTRWAEKHGHHVANLLKRRVEAELPDYNYLYKFKLLS